MPPKYSISSSMLFTMPSFQEDEKSSNQIDDAKDATAYL